VFDQNPLHRNLGGEAEHCLTLTMLFSGDKTSHKGGDQTGETDRHADKNKLIDRMRLEEGRKYVGNNILHVETLSLAGQVQQIQLRSYWPAAAQPGMPIILYFHGGGFVRGDLNDADVAASAIASRTPAWVVSVSYSLAPAFPFPTALEDAYLATRWALDNANIYGADSTRLGVAGHDAGGNLATGLAAMARDRADFAFTAQALLAPLLDPSMTRMADDRNVVDPDMNRGDCARCYRAYLPNASMRLHPYAAPLESRRLGGLPATLIASAANDLLHVEAEKYAGELIAAGVPTAVTRHANTSHTELAEHRGALDDVVSFFKKWLLIDAGNRPVPLHERISTSQLR